MESKVVKINRNLGLLDDLEELTNPNSIHYDADVAEEKEEIKAKILSGEITDL
jgi:hypothetical protein